MADKSFKEQLRDEILPKTVDYYNSGLDINSAIVKAAEEFKLNLDQADRLLETMNTARVIAHYEKNAEDRTANCDVADKDVVRKMLFADKPTEKKAAFGPTGMDWGSYASYMFQERDYRHAGMTKAAETASSDKPVSEFTMAQALGHVAKYARDVEAQRKFAEERLEMGRAQVATSLSKIASSLSKGYEPEIRYALFKAACSKTCPEVIKSIESELAPRIIKDATPHLRKFNRANVIDTRPVETEIKLAEDIEDDISQLGRIQGIIAARKANEDEVKGVIHKYAEAIKVARSHGPRRGTSVDHDRDRDRGHDRNRGHDSDRSSTINIPSYSSRTSGSSGSNPKDRDDQSPWMDKAVGFTQAITPADKAAKGVYDYITGAMFTPEAILDAMRPEPRKSDTSIKSYIENIQRSEILSDLYNNDDIISEHSPEDVTRAYQALVAANPELSLHKEVVRSVLRQAVNATSISPFDAKQWADTGSAIAKNKRDVHPVIMGSRF